MKNLSFFILLLLSISIISCKKDENGGTTKHGYSYTLFKTGKGELVKTNDLVFFDMVIMHKDSILQDSKTSGQQPEFQMPPDSLMTSPNPVVDGLALMREGDSIVIRERIDTMPKENFPPNMKDWKEITYTIKVKSIVGEGQKKVVREMEPSIEKMLNQDIADYKSKSIKDLKSTPTGLKYVIHGEGDGPMIQKGETAKVYYYGATVADAKKFDSSYGKGTSFSVPVGSGRVIQGWEEALLLMKKGTKATFFIPANLAYGEKGIPDMIAPNAELAFYIEVLK